MSQCVRTNFDLQVDNMLPFHQLIVIKWSVYVFPLDNPTSCFTLSEVLIFLVYRPLLISLG